MGARAKDRQAAAGSDSADQSPPAAWERKEGESLHGYEAFVLYRSSTERKTASVARALGLELETVDNLAKRHKWKERAAAWDAEVDRRLRETEVDALAQMRRRQIEIGIGMQHAAALELRSLVRSIEAAEASAGGGPRDHVLKPAELVKLVEAGVNIERVNRGADTPDPGGEANDTAPRLVVYLPDNGRGPCKVG